MVFERLVLTLKMQRFVFNLILVMLSAEQLKSLAEQQVFIGRSLRKNPRSSRRLKLYGFSFISWPTCINRSTRFLDTSTAKIQRNPSSSAILLSLKSSRMTVVAISSSTRRLSNFMRCGTRSW
jgi:hypothetical protein